MVKYLIGAVAIILIVGGGYYVWEKRGAAPPPEEPITQEPQTATYASSTLGGGISLTYPTDYRVNASYAYEGFVGKPIAGVSFAIPASMVAGTNLSDDTYISVESLPRARSCSGDIYLLANVRAEELSDGGREWSFASSTEAAAGNVYEEHVYAIPASDPCVAVRYYIHSGNIANFDPGVATEFDRFALLSALDAIRRSIVFPGTMQATTTSNFSP